MTEGSCVALFRTAYRVGHYARVLARNTMLLLSRRGREPSKAGNHPRPGPRREEQTDSRRRAKRQATYIKREVRRRERGQQTMGSTAAPVRTRSATRAGECEVVDVKDKSRVFPGHRRLSAAVEQAMYRGLITSWSEGQWSISNDRPRLSQKPKCTA